MKHIILFCFSLGFYSGFSQTTIDYSKLNLSFEEHFNGTADALWNSGNWDYQYAHGDLHFQKTNIKTRRVGKKRNLIHKYSKDNITVNNGLLSLKMTKLPHYKTTSFMNNTYEYQYEGAVVRTTYNQPAYCDKDNPGGNGWMLGLFEVRCKIPNNAYLYPALWLCPSNSWPPEVDLIEIDHKNDKVFDFYSNAYWCNGYPCDDIKNSPVFYQTANDSFFNEFHTWQVLLTQDTVTYFLDGVKMRTFVWPKQSRFNGCYYNKMQLIIGLNATFAKKGAYWKKKPNQYKSNNTMLIDYVKVYQAKHNNYKGVLIETSNKKQAFELIKQRKRRKTVYLLNN